MGRRGTKTTEAEFPNANLIAALVVANRILAGHDVLDGYGHVSARHDRNPNRYLLSRAQAPEFVTADDIMESDVDGNAADARGRLTYVEPFIHGGIYRARRTWQPSCTVTRLQ